MFSFIIHAMNPIGLMFALLGRMSVRNPRPVPDPQGRQGAAVPLHG